MDDESKNDVDKVEDEIMLPGFRFHPTDEELVGFYLKRKIQHRSLPIELIKQLDIYKYEPWDLPKVAASGEKEWYFYCPRDRKYRNSARPNRVTSAGFWKATGTDRPIYSSDLPTKCIGLKKSLVFYRGRAAKGSKTDWMMHEFRLPSNSDKTLSANDSWAICRIFRKMNSMAQRALSHTLIPSLPSDIPHHCGPCNQFNSENISYSNNELLLLQHAQQQQWGLSPPLPVSNGDIHNNSMFSQCSVDASSIVLSPETMMTTMIPDDVTKEVQRQQLNGFSISLPQHMQGTRNNSNEALDDIPWGTIRSMGFPFSLSPNLLDSFKPNLPWHSPECPSDMSTAHSTDKCST